MKAQPKMEDAAELERDRFDLETRLKEAQSEISEFVKNQETLEKIIKDKDRQTRQDKKQIEFLDNSIKHTRGELRSTQEMLETKETQVRDLEKEIENLKCSIKSINVRFDREKNKADMFEEKFSKSELQLKKAWHFLTEGNKAIKMKDTTIKTLQEQKKKLESLVKQFTQTADGKTVSLESIHSVLNQQPTTLVLSTDTNDKSFEDQLEDLKTKLESGDAGVVAKFTDESKESFFNPESVDDAEMAEVMEGEIMDGEEDPEQIRINKLQMLATKTLNPPVVS